MSEEPLDPQFLEALRDALKHVALPEVGTLTRSQAIRDLGMDSITLVEMVIILEENLGVTLEHSDIDNLRTIGDLQDLMRARSQSH
ncbi:MAG: hypothetical protein AMXMBFR33_16860 [Candidatus Xenobia bacterium]|jgi:acyl carrier protein